MQRSILITGASSGIGAALARELAARGHRLALTARRLDRLQALAEELRAAHGVQVEVAALDVSQVEQVPATLKALATRLAGLDIVIANAGIAGSRRMGTGDIALDRRIMDTNYLGAVATLDAATTLFRQSGHGRLVGMSSIAAWLPLPGSGSYCASKAALTAYLDCARVELGKHGISVLAIHPGFIDTDIAADMRRYPFVISADKAAVSMADAILAENTQLIVPTWPWRWLVPVAGRLPRSWLARWF